MEFQDLFERLAGEEDPGSPRKPWEWQGNLAAQPPTNVLIRISTGLGKTLGVLAAWVWHRIIHEDDAWPRRLVWCLPMRVLVEQTHKQVEKSLEGLGVLWEGMGDHKGKVGVHLLMGGADGGEWSLYPEHYAVLIGTQDMLLSRAMNRGYGAPRARWPMEFGLLNQDCLWVMDEVQLMDVGLATSAQLQAFRDEDAVAGRSMRPCSTWWMSATLQADWLRKSPDTKALSLGLPEIRIPPWARVGHLWDDVAKPCVKVEIKNAGELADLVATRHIEAGRGAAGPTLVVVNTVDHAAGLVKALTGERRLKGTDVRLVHSRFRPAERVTWRDEFLNRDACAPHTDRIIVATQVIEAGVDLSAGLLITELAPWASLVQRFGRCARWGGTANVIVVDFGHKDDHAAAPYRKDELDAAREALASLPDVAPLQLEEFEESHLELLPRLYPYEPMHLLLRNEVDELFDTTPDLSGADVDISRFIRSGEERDLQVFWVDVPVGEGPLADLKPAREALCAVPFLRARDWLFGNKTATAKTPRPKKGMRAWVWDWQDGDWRRAECRDLYPGQTVLVAAVCGGYDRALGWSAKSTDAVVVVPPVPDKPAVAADSKENGEPLSAYPWKTIATHGRETGSEACGIARSLAPALSDLFDLAGRWHDGGKSHPAFYSSIIGSGRPNRHDLAKAPKSAWLRGRNLYPMPDGTRRPGFRHELVSVLALFAVLQRHAPDHPALLGPWRELLEQAGILDHGAPAIESVAVGLPTPIEKEILALDAGRFDLLAYLVCAHHGKLRVAWHLGKGDQEAGDSALRIRGVREGEVLGSLLLAAADGSLYELPPIPLNLAPAANGLNARTGRGWTERVLGLLQTHGPFTLAWLEALLRAADQRASKLNTADPLLAVQIAEGGDA
jgi:CRISPR-associated endonuclease/helicase Cas3